MANLNLNSMRNIDKIIRKVDKMRLRLLLMLFGFVLTQVSGLAQPGGFIELAIRSYKAAIVYPDKNLSSENVQLWKDYAEVLRSCYSNNWPIVASSVAEKAKETKDCNLVILGNPQNNHIMKQYLANFENIEIGDNRIRIGDVAHSTKENRGLNVLIGGTFKNENEGDYNYCALLINYNDYPEIKYTTLKSSFHYDFFVADIFSPLYMGIIEGSQKTSKLSPVKSKSKKFIREKLKSVSSGQYEYFFDENNYFNDDKGWLIKFQDEALKRIEERLGIKYNGKIGFYLFNDKKQMCEVTGLKANGAADQFLPCVYTFYKKGRAGAIGAHEVTHVLTGLMWSKNYPGGLIDEGCAEFTALDWSGKSHISIAKKILNTGKLPTLLQLENNWDNYEDKLRYPIAACFIRFLKETFGLKKVQELYQKAYKLKNGQWMNTILNLKPEELQQNFEAWIRKAES